MPEPNLAFLKRRKTDRVLGIISIVGDWLKKCWWIALILLLAVGISLSGFHFEWNGIVCDKTKIDVKKGEPGVEP